MTEEDKKTLLGDLYEKLNKAQNSSQHQSVLEHTDKSTHPFIHLISGCSLEGGPRGTALGKAGEAHCTHQDEELRAGVGAHQGQGGAVCGGNGLHTAQTGQEQRGLAGN